MNCSFCCAAIGCANTARPTAAAVKANILWVILLLLCIPAGSAGAFNCEPLFSSSMRRAAPHCALSPSRWPSIGIGPKSELLLGDRPQPGEAMRLLDEQVADQRAEDD